MTENIFPEVVKKAKCCYFDWSEGIRLSNKKCIRNV